MRPRQPTNLAASVRQRLYNLARAQGKELQLVLTRYAVERLLYRLSCTPGGERLVLKGAVLFYVWEDAPHRPTRDVDFSSFGDPSPNALIAVFRAVCAAEVEPDGLTFPAESVAAASIRGRQEHGGVHITLTAMLGTARIPLQLDVGFGDAITPGPRIETIPTLLDFPAPRVRTYPPETVIAEKFQAMVSLGIANTRLKDFFDVWVLSETHEFDGSTLAGAIGATFERRTTPLPDRTPLALTTAFGRDPEKHVQWGRFLERSHITGAPDDLEAVVKLIGAFVLPPAFARAQGTPFVAQWLPTRGWEPPPR